MSFTLPVEGLHLFDIFISASESSGNGLSWKLEPRDPAPSSREDPKVSFKLVESGGVRGLRISLSQNNDDDDTSSRAASEALSSERASIAPTPGPHQTLVNSASASSYSVLFQQPSDSDTSKGHNERSSSPGRAVTNPSPLSQLCNTLPTMVASSPSSRSGLEHNNMPSASALDHAMSFSMNVHTSSGPSIAAAERPHRLPPTDSDELIQIQSGLELSPSPPPRPKKRYNCTMGCSQAFSRQHDRLRHEVLKHDKRCKWSCQTCGRFFSSESRLRSHKCSSGESVWRV